MKLSRRSMLLLSAATSASALWLPAWARAQASWSPVEPIDFSSKRDVLILNEDGTTTPMNEPYYVSTEIAPGTWQVQSDGDHFYLVEGDDEALAIDTGYGAGNTREYLQTLTDKPVRYVVNTHYHFDHTANNAYFDGAYMTAITAEQATVPYDRGLLGL